MKKTIATSLALAMLLGLSACGGRSDDTPIEKPSSVSAHTTEPTTSDVVEYDPLENVEITIYEATEYPAYLYFHYDYSFDNEYEELKCINAKIVSADSKKLTIELFVDENAVAEFFEDTPYVLKNTKKEIVFDINEIPTRPLYSKIITDKTITDIGIESKKRILKAIEQYNYKNNCNDELCIEAVYAVTLANDETFLNDYQFIENGKYFGGVDVFPYNTPNPYQLWFAFKNKDGKVFIQSTSKCIIINKELHDYRFNQYDIYDKDIYDSIEAAKKSIEDSIAEYDNVQLEELPIPDSLK